MKFKSIPECCCNSFDLYKATICLKDRCFVFFFEWPLKTGSAVHSKAVVLLLLTFCLLLLPLWESVIVLCFVVRYFMSILVLQSS